MSISMAERTCLKCGWVHFGISFEEAISQVNNFNSWLALQSPEVQQSYSGRPRDSRKCFKCGNDYKNFRDAVDGDAPGGCTLQSIIIV